METRRRIILTGAGILLLFSSGITSGSNYHPVMSNSKQTTTKSTQTKTTKAQTTTKSTQTKAKSAQTKTTQTKTKPAQTTTKSAQTKAKSVPTKTKAATTGTKPAPTKKESTEKSIKPEPEKKASYPGTVSIGTQTWASANLNVSTFRNGDTIPEVKTNKEWAAAGDLKKPAWCYYNNDPAYGAKYGKLYNWYAVTDPRGLAPAGWRISSADDWAKLAYYLGGQEPAGMKMKSNSGWNDSNNGTNATGFTGLPGGYRVENGIFLNIGTIGIWWSTTESKGLTAIDHYLSQTGSLGRSSSPRQRGDSVRCLRE